MGLSSPVNSLDPSLVLDAVVTLRLAVEGGSDPD